MSDGDKLDDKDDEDDDETEYGPVLDGQDFVQEEYDLKLLLEATITRINHQSIVKYADKDAQQLHNQFSDEFLFFTQSLRQVFDQHSMVLNQIIQEKLSP